jgi:ribosomal protein S8E
MLIWVLPGGEKFMVAQVLNGTDLQLSSAADFAPETYKLKLPTGRVVEVKEVDLIGLITAGNGDVPDFISGQVLAGLNGRHGAKAITIDKNNVGEMFSFINTIVKASVVSHKVVDKNADRAIGEINLGDLTTEDKLAIFNAVMPLEAAAASSFRQRVETTNLAVVRSRPDHRDETEPDPGAEQ